MMYQPERRNMDKEKLKQNLEYGEQKLDSWLVRLADSQYTLFIVVLVAIVAAYFYFVK